MTDQEHYIATCPSCGDVVTKDGAAPRERLCKCGTWVPYVLREVPAETLSSIIESAQGDT